MPRILPQEIDVWYLIPSIRREISKILFEKYNLKQKEIAEILQISEAAVSQYRKQKRAVKIIFKKEELKIIEEIAVKIIKDKPNSNIYFYELTQRLRKCSSVCNLHHKLDDSISDNCNICKKNKNS